MGSQWEASRGLLLILQQLLHSVQWSCTERGQPLLLLISWGSFLILPCSDARCFQCRPLTPSGFVSCFSNYEAISRRRAKVTTHQKFSETQPFVLWTLWVRSPHPSHVLWCLTFSLIPWTLGCQTDALCSPCSTVELTWEKGGFRGCLRTSITQGGTSGDSYKSGSSKILRNEAESRQSQ